MASEDSDQLLPGLLAVHGLRDAGDPDEPIGLEMPSAPHKLETLRELAEVLSLRREKRMCPEERNDRLQELIAPADAVLRHVLAVVVVPGVCVDPTDPEERLEIFETADAAHTLRDNEPMEHLIAGLVTASIRPIWLPNEADREASFSVYKTNNPASSDQSFLLIFRTVRIFTEHRANL
jgi:hypothetical protein